MVPFMIAETLVEFILSVNRCVFFTAPDFAQKWFPEEDRRTWFWAVPPISIAFVYWMIGTAAFFSGVLKHWAWNPHYGYADQINDMVSSWSFLLINFVSIGMRR